MRSFRHIRSKLLVMVLLTMFSAITVAGAFILYNDLREYRNTRINDLTTQIGLLAASSATALQFEDTAVAQENLELLRLRPSVRAAAIYNARGNHFATYTREGEHVVFPELPGDEGIETVNDNLVIFSRIVADGEILGTAYISGDYLIWQRAIDFIQINSLIALTAMAVAALVCLPLQASITKPLFAITDIAREVVNSRDFGRRVKRVSDDEIGVLVDAFNEMLNEIGKTTVALQDTNRQLEQEAGEHRASREMVMKLNAELERKVLERTQALQVANKELESFCYSVSHDLRGPLRAISGFTRALQEDYGTGMPDGAHRYFDKVIAASSRMGQLIEDLLNLSRVSRGELVRQQVNFSTMAHQIADDLKQQHPGYVIEVSIWEGISAEADQKLLRIVLENLMGNSWKFTTKQSQPRVEVGVMRDGQREIYFVRDNGAGFDMKYADKLFGAFQRLHGAGEFPGTGIGLATVQRIINRHGGRIWFDSTPGKGAVFYFTLKSDLVVDPLT